MDKMYKSYYQCPIGVLEIIGCEQGISSINFVDEHKGFIDVPCCLKECIKQLDEYFKGTRQIFNLNLYIEGTSFRKKVWKKLQEIPYGETCSYKDIAISIDNVKAVRAVGNANHHNNISIVIPCHRVIGSNSSLTGYAGGLWRKEWLLNHEKHFKDLRHDFNKH